MTQLTNSKLVLNSLKTLDGLLAASLKFPGEDFHQYYKKYPQIFSDLVRADKKLYKGLTGYFRDLTYRVNDKINWSNYNAELFKAVVSDFISTEWDDETLILKVIVTDSLLSAIEAGGHLTELDTSIDIGWSAGTSAAQDFLKNYTLKLASGLTDTTIDRVKSSLSHSLASGFDQQQASSALDDVIDDDRRANMIAHTETVRAFNQGRLSVADEVGADRKMWSATAGACPICDPLDGQIVGLDESFDDGSDAPPAHPNCRCIVRILMPNETQSDLEE